MYKPLRSVASNREINIQATNQGVYYLFFKEDQNSRKCKIGIRYPGFTSTPFIVLGGKRAKDIYDFISQLLENAGIRHFSQKDGSFTVTELPLATGLATTIFLLAAYSSLHPLKHATTLEKMILGRMPFTKYLVTLTELSTELSGYWSEKGSRKQTLQRQAAISVSKMLLELISGIEKQSASK